MSGGVRGDDAVPGTASLITTRLARRPLTRRRSGQDPGVIPAGRWPRRSTAAQLEARQPGGFGFAVRRSPVRDNPVVAVLLAGFVGGRLAVWFREPVFPTPDSPGYRGGNGLTLSDVLSFSGHAARLWGTPLFYGIFPDGNARGSLDAAPAKPTLTSTSYRNSSRLKTQDPVRLRLMRDTAPVDA
jgi:hypothetical protein